MTMYICMFSVAFGTYLMAICIAFNPVTGSERG